MGIDALAAKLDARFAILTGGGRTALPRQRTMRALIDWSYVRWPAREFKKITDEACSGGDAEGMPGNGILTFHTVGVREPTAPPSAGRRTHPGGSGGPRTDER